MSYVDLGATWVDYTTAGDAPCGTGTYRIGRLRPMRCTPPPSGDTFIPLNQVDLSKYDIVESLNSGAQVVTKGGVWEGAFAYADYGGCPAGQVRPTPIGPCIARDTPRTSAIDLTVTGPAVVPPGGLPSMTEASCRAQGGVVSYPYNNDNIVCTIPPEVKCAKKGGRIVNGQCVIGAGVTITSDGNQIDPNTGLAVKKSGNNTLLYVGLALAAVGAGVYYYKKRKR